MADRIVVLDGYTLNPGDIDWGPISSQGEFTVHDRTPPENAEAIVERAAGAPYVLTNKTPLSAETIGQLPDLKYIGVLATGYNIVDVAAARERSIPVTNVPTYGTDSVAQHAAALMLDLSRSLGRHVRAVREGEWAAQPDFCFAAGPVTELSGKVLGIVGLGRIGIAMARIGDAMGMRVVAYDHHWPAADRLTGLQVESVTLDELFRKADVVSLHCPLTDDNHHFVDAARLGQMKGSAILINTSRGPLVDEAALAEALRAGTIAGAGLDVLETEPPPADHPLIGLPNCVVTPHVAWYARAARERLLRTAADNLRAFVAGEAQNVVN